ncbi:hypothetical protein RhiirA5_406490 [Rhizophagus irregularis]|uniref:DNA-directed RNA polymerase n=3 Tax=Rhizophagus irregularis TaxID=588596 RepID=A0A2I1F8W3_9GLOM|nr:RNA polymerase beta subunit-domain-containing protein [Rhizophagus irregularis DAOM 181602=DAOM 197198]EXX74820.1 Rpb2p [Rhizophagus irregularis DAOM 197198w]PKC16921.1 hypothetical protein RhiirA5_406490 [Rhizophagus irregularis]PKC73892.1 hypothetical protein RhiirA1_518902 [Rhizophagus irregularis]PKK80690.1 hypothetical protein RhiirC2_831448 [Rhizophagus irregularis]PKY30807.1 hypothetical protein RhiirB3_392851 [Rhizophagus irregularis]|eukprot:XP_025189019.1 RNA polymerase beta subunit-domain-containing protein [Rhizophagus irregularis DAOM 181602=DAOM 197198]
MFLQEACLRNLTYAAPLYVNIKEETMITDPRMPENREKAILNEIFDEDDLKYDPEETSYDVEKIPVMLKLTFYVLQGLDDKSLYALNECPYDQSGYFIINGSEKVLIAQERMMFMFLKNHCLHLNIYIYSFTAEIKSAIEKGSKLISSLMIKLLAKTAEK